MHLVAAVAHGSLEHLFILEEVLGPRLDEAGLTVLQPPAACNQSCLGCSLACTICSLSQSSSPSHGSPPAWVAAVAAAAAGSNSKLVRHLASKLGSHAARGLSDHLHPVDAQRAAARMAVQTIVQCRLQTHDLQVWYLSSCSNRGLELAVIPDVKQICCQTMAKNAVDFFQASCDEGVVRQLQQKAYLNGWSDAGY